MNILLIRPPARYVPGASRPAASIPVGILSIAAVLEEDGFRVEVLDAQTDVSEPVRREADGAIHAGLPWDQLEREITARKPDIVGISCPFTAQRNGAIRAAGIARRAAPGALIIVGGSHVTVRPEDFFRETSAVDIVCRGEGEWTMREISRARQRGDSLRDIPGTVVRDGEDIRHNPLREPILSLDDLPYPAYHLIDLEGYFLLRKRGYTDRPERRNPGFERAVPVVTSRGCPYGCVFCSIHLHMGRRFRPHSVGYVLRHIEFLRSRYDIRHVHFEDDNLTFDVGRFRGILDGLLRYGGRLTWDTPNGVRVDTLSREILVDCRRSGCDYLIFGVESGNQRVLNQVVRKRLDLDEVVRVAAACRDVGLDAMAFFVIGFPGENRKEMQDTVEFALMLQRRFGLTPHLYVATPLPGTRLERDFLEREILSAGLSPEELARMTQGEFFLDGGTFKAEDVRAMRRRFLRGSAAVMLGSSIGYFLRHPAALPGFARRVLEASRHASLKDAILGCWRFRSGTDAEPGVAGGHPG